jgi:Exonuclease
MTVFTPETPLGQDVQKLLLDHRDGLTIPEMRRRLRLEKGLAVNEANLRELLRHGRTFTALSDGRYVLTGHAPDRGPDQRRDHDKEAEPDDPLVQPLILNLPRVCRDYVIFDLETTGTDSARDRIIQIVALKVAGGRPLAARMWYVNPGAVLRQGGLGPPDEPGRAGSRRRLSARAPRRGS